MMIRIFKIIEYILWAIFLVIFTIYLTSVLSLYVFHSKYPCIFGYTYFEVATGSMRNTINEQDIIIVKLDKTYKEGDIITYKSGDSFITHRIVKITEDKIITKGDNNNLEDAPIEKDAIVGRVVKVLCNMGVVLKVISDKTTIILMGMFMVVVLYIRSLKGRNEE